MANISSYNQLSSWNEDDDLLFVQQPDAPKKAHPSQMKEYILGGLDVSSVGGTGKYISEISEADGKINATAETMDVTPTEGSLKAVTSDGIKTAIDESVSLKTATGNPITLTDAANANAEELLMTIEPIQSGSGDPSPTNVRPISGISEAAVTRTGKNLFNGLYSETGVFLLADGSTASGGTSWNISEYIPIKGDETYTISFDTGNQNSAYVCCYDKNKTYISSFAFATAKSLAIKTPSNASFLRTSVVRTATNFQIEYGTTPTAYEPYTGATATITLGQTVYGGSVNFKTGEVTVTHGMVDLGDYDYGITQGLFVMSEIISDAKAPTEQGIESAFCSSYKHYYTGETISLSDIPDKSFALCIKAMSYTRKIAVIRDSSYTDATAFKTAMSGVQLCYELETPTTLTLTPAELELLKGNNTITANGAEISIEYYPDNAIGVLAGRVDDLDNTTSDMQEQITGLDTRVTALEEAGGGVSDFVQIGETASGVVSSGTLTAMMHKSNIANYSEFMFVAYCDDDSATVPAPIMLNKKLVQRVIDNSNSFSVTNGTITFTIKPQASFPVNHVVAELSGITTTDKRYNIEFYGRAI